MAHNISGFGLRINLRASATFPSGIDLSAFADDGDPFDIPSVQIADKAMGPNGDLVVWSKANPITTTINVIPGSDDDRNLEVLFDANRPERGKIPAMDEVTLTGVYPDGRTITLAGGYITDGMPGNSIASAGRKKTKAYQFAFESISRS